MDKVKNLLDNIDDYKHKKVKQIAKEYELPNYKEVKDDEEQLLKDLKKFLIDLNFLIHRVNKSIPEKIFLPFPKKRITIVKKKLTKYNLKFLN